MFKKLVNLFRSDVEKYVWVPQYKIKHKIITEDGSKMMSHTIKKIYISNKTLSRNPNKHYITIPKEMIKSHELLYKFIRNITGEINTIKNTHIEIMIDKLTVATYLTGPSANPECNELVTYYSFNFQVDYTIVENGNSYSNSLIFIPELMENSKNVYTLKIFSIVKLKDNDIIYNEVEELCRQVTSSLNENSNDFYIDNNDEKINKFFFTECVNEAFTISHNNIFKDRMMVSKKDKNVFANSPKLRKKYIKRIYYKGVINA